MYWWNYLLPRTMRQTNRNIAKRTDTCPTTKQARHLRIYLSEPPEAAMREAILSQRQQRRLINEERGLRGGRRGRDGDSARTRGGGAASRPPPRPPPHAPTRPRAPPATPRAPGPLRTRPRSGTRTRTHAPGPSRSAAPPARPLTHLPSPSRILWVSRRGPSAENGVRDVGPRIPTRGGARAPGKCSPGPRLRGHQREREPRLPPDERLGAPLPAHRFCAIHSRRGRVVPTRRGRYPEDRWTRWRRRGEWEGGGQQSSEFRCVRGGPCPDSRRERGLRRREAGCSGGGPGRDLPRGWGSAVPQGAGSGRWAGEPGAFLRGLEQVREFDCDL